MSDIPIIGAHAQVQYEHVPVPTSDTTAVLIPLPSGNFKLLTLGGQNPVIRLAAELYASGRAKGAVEATNMAVEFYDRAEGRLQEIARERERVRSEVHP